MPSAAGAARDQRRARGPSRRRPPRHRPATGRPSPRPAASPRPAPAHGAAQSRVQSAAHLVLHLVERLHRRRRHVLHAERVVGRTAGGWRLHLDQPRRIALLRLERRLDQRGLQFCRRPGSAPACRPRCCPGRPACRRRPTRPRSLGISSRLAPLPSTLSTLLARSYIRSAALPASTWSRSASFTCVEAPLAAWRHLGHPDDDTSRARPSPGRVTVSGAAANTACARSGSGNSRSSRRPARSPTPPASCAAFCIAAQSAPPRQLSPRAPGLRLVRRRDHLGGALLRRDVLAPCAAHRRRAGRRR